MRTQGEVWFRTSTIRGFGTVHWKGPIFVVAMSTISLVGAVLALATDGTYPIIAIGGVAITVGAIVVGTYVCALHTERDS